jgi:pimeloyl-ACP methyl ester carboxylesterase
MSMGMSHGLVANVVLIHGGWHCSASWGEVAPLLRAGGRYVVAPDLPGHGWQGRFPGNYFSAGQLHLETAKTTLGDITLEMAAATVLDALRAVRAVGNGKSPVVLVSHSSSGAIASLAAEMAPELVDHLFYIAAIVPSRLRSAAAYAALPEYGSPTMDGLVVGDPAVVGALRINPRSTDPEYRDLLHRKFYGDAGREEAAAFANLLCADQPMSFISDEVTVTRERWGSIPRTYLQTMNDLSIAPAVQDIVIRDADDFTPDNKFRHLTIDSGHSPFASRPQDVAEAIASCCVAAQ